MFGHLYQKNPASCRNSTLQVSEIVLKGYSMSQLFSIGHIPVILQATRVTRFCCRCLFRCRHIRANAWTPAQVFIIDKLHVGMDTYMDKANDIDNISCLIGIWKMWSIMTSELDRSVHCSIKIKNQSPEMLSSGENHFLSSVTLKIDRWTWK